MATPINTPATAVAEVEETRRAVSVQASSPLLPHSFDQAVKLAEVMSKGKLVPAHLQSSPADCLMVIEQAMRWRMSPFAVGQCTSSIHGKLMFEGKLVAAAIYNSGLLEGRLGYEFSGTGESRAVKVTGKVRGSAKAESVDVALKDARTSNEHWKKQPDQQLIYAGTRVWARRHAPEVMLGVYTPDEDFGDTAIDHAPTASVTAVVEKPAYPQDDIEKNREAWLKIIAESPKTGADQIINKLSSKYALTDEQKGQIRGFASAEGAQA